MKIKKKYGTPAERFERYYMPEPNSGCWIWLGSLSRNGYGWFYYPPRNMVRAHIAAWELYRGPRNGFHVLHNCDNPTCVNPEHLYLGTVQDNMNDRERRGRGAVHIGSLNNNAKLTEADIIAIRADKRWPRFIAKDWNTPVSTIKHILRRETWKHIP